MNRKKGSSGWIWMNLNEKWKKDIKLMEA
jgi:hypothetical protein